MKKRWQMMLVLLLGTVFLLGGFPSVYAAEEDEEQKAVFTLDTIVVTAEKREESILEVPISLTAFDDAKIEALGMTGADDLEQLTPGLQFGDFNEQVGQGTVIRGIGSRMNSKLHNDLAVATYVDGVYTHSTYGISPNFFDVGRIEIARGPQGTLHGRNSIAGSISLFYKRPTDEWDADILTEFTDQFTQRYNVAFGGPILNGLSFRITGGYYDGEGAQENIGLGNDYDEPHQMSFAPQLQFKSDRFDINLRYSWTEDDGSPKTQVVLRDFDRENLQIFQHGRVTNGKNGAYGYPESEIIPAIANCSPGELANKCEDLENVVNVNAPGLQQSTRKAWSLNADYSITESLLLRYTFGTSDTESATTRDRDGMNRVIGGYDGNPLLVGPGQPIWDWRVHSISMVEEQSHELQVISNFDGPINFILGAFYYDNSTQWEQRLDNFSTDYRFLNAQEEFEKSNADLTEFFLATELADVVPPTTGFAECNDVALATYDVLVLFGYGDQYTPFDCTAGSDHKFMRFDATGADSETKALFGHLDYQITDTLLVSSGLRYTKDKKKQGDTSAFQILNANEIYKAIGPMFGFPNLTANIPLQYSWHDFNSRGSDTWDAYIWNVSAEYTPGGSNTMVYGRISTGYRAGAFNYTSPWWTPPKVDEETLVNYEVGVKTLSADQRLLFMGSAFYSTYEGFQINASQPIPGVFGGPSSMQTYTTNVDGTTIWGVELEGSYLVTEDLQVSGYYAYMDSELGSHASIIELNPVENVGTYPEGCVFGVDDPCAEYWATTDLTGNQLAMQPNHKWALTVAYTMPMPNLMRSPGSLGMLRFLSTYSYTGDRHPNIANVPEHKMQGYGRWDLRVQWTAESGRWSAGVFVQNVLDEIGLIEYLPVNANSNESPPLGTLTDPRRFGGFIRWKL